MRDGIAKSAVLTEKFDCLYGPDFDTTRNQNSIVLASKIFLKVWEVISVDKSKLPAGLASGDLCVVREVSLDDNNTGRKPFVIASSTATRTGYKPSMSSKPPTATRRPNSTLIFALDANCHRDDNKGKRLSIETMFALWHRKIWKTVGVLNIRRLPTTTCTIAVPPTSVKQSRFLQRQANERVSRQAPERPRVRLLWDVCSEPRAIESCQ